MPHRTCARLTAHGLSSACCSTRVRQAAHCPLNTRRAVHGCGADTEDGTFEGTSGSPTHFSMRVRAGAVNVPKWARALAAGGGPAHSSPACATLTRCASPGAPSPTYGPPCSTCSWGAARCGTKGCNTRAAAARSRRQEGYSRRRRRAPTGSVVVFAPRPGSLIRMASAGSMGFDVARPSYRSPARLTVAWIAAVPSVGYLYSSSCNLLFDWCYPRLRQ